MKTTLLAILVILTVSLVIPWDAVAVTSRVFIETPGPCHQVTKIDGNRVSLTSGATACDPNIRMVQADVDDSLKEISVFIDGHFYKKVAVQTMSIEPVRELAEAAKNKASNMKVQDNSHMAEGIKAAQKSFQNYQSEAYQQKLAIETERVRSTLFSKQTDSFVEKMKETAASLQGGGNSKKLSSNERIYIFISSSMPLSTIRAYAEAIDKIGDPNIFMVMRGFIGGMRQFKPTQEYIMNATKKDSGCNPAMDKCDVYTGNVIVDPLLYRKYDIQQVPVVLYAPNVTIVDPGASEGKEGNAQVEGDIFSVTGDVSMEFALSQFFKETKRDSIKNTLRSLNKSYYN